jgi:hypothetical protein
MRRADEYRQYAAECLRVAQELSASEEKGRLLAMAQKWHELAKQAEGMRRADGAVVTTRADFQNCPGVVQPVRRPLPA